MYLKKQKIKNRLLSIELKNPTIIMVGSKYIEFALINFKVWWDPAAKITGIDITKEILLLANKLKPRNKPAVTVMPDLDTPGIIANAWAIPKNIMCLIDRSDNSKSVLLDFTCDVKQQ